MAQAPTSGPVADELARRGLRVAAGTSRHSFIRQIADGSLPQEAFLRYLVQNALFLTGYAAALRESLEAGAPPPVAALLAELQAAISGPALDAHAAEYQSRSGRALRPQVAAPSAITVAYVDHLRVSARSGAAALLVAILPGEQSYAAAGRYYATVGDLTSANPYAGWIAQYATGQVDELVAQILAALAAAESAGQTSEDLLLVYERSAQLDSQFWEMAGKAEES